MHTPLPSQVENRSSTLWKLEQHNKILWRHSYTALVGLFLIPTQMNHLPTRIINKVKRRLSQSIFFFALQAHINTSHSMELQLWLTCNWYVDTYSNGSPERHEPHLNIKCLWNKCLPFISNYSQRFSKKGLLISHERHELLNVSSLLSSHFDLLIKRRPESWKQWKRA